MRPAYKEGEVIVRFKKGVGRARMTEVAATHGLGQAKRFRALSQAHGQEIALFRAPGKSAAGLVAALRRHPQVESVSLNYRKELRATLPDDPLFGEQWPLHNLGQTGGVEDADVDGPEAWDRQTGSSDVVVAVLDTGVNYLHPDLDDNLWRNPGEIPDNGVDDDGNGYVDDVFGIDTGNGDTDPMDDHGHGTHVSGTVAAEGGNGQGVAGVNWNARVMAVKGFAADGYMYTDAELEALDYILMMRLRGENVVAVNASFGCYGCFDAIEKAAIETLGAAGVVFVAAAGNDGTNNDTEPHYPSSYDCPNLLSVAATDSSDNLAGFSNYGPTSVDLGAPGQEVLSTVSWIDYSLLPGGPFADDMESGMTQWWQADAPWAITEEQALSPTHAWSDSPGGEYANDTFAAIYANPVDLSGVSGQYGLGFSSRFDLERNYDWLDVYFFQGGAGLEEWALTEEQALSPTHAWSDSPGGNYSNNTSNWLLSPVVDLGGGADFEEWQLTSELSYNGEYAWSDSPGGNYSNETYNVLMSPVIDLSGASQTNLVALDFMLTGQLEADYDSLLVYYSADGGASWTYSGYYLTGDASDQWYWVGFPAIPPEFRTAQFRMAFVLDSDFSITYDGYHIDDVWVYDWDLDVTHFRDTLEFGEGGWAHYNASSGGGSAGVELDFALTGAAESDWDYLDVYCSGNGGGMWTYLGSLTGEFAGWYGIYASLATECITSQARVAFNLWSDGSITEDGYYIDDVSLYSYGSGTYAFSDDLESGGAGWEHVQANNGGEWVYMGGVTGSTGGAWRDYVVPIPNAFLTPDFDVAFVLTSDATITGDGAYVDDVAVGPVSATPVHGYQAWSGTSMATPHVTGAVALAAAEHPGDSAAERRQRILDGVDPLASLAGQVATDGRLNLAAALGEPDQDGDGVPDDLDNCPAHVNPSQVDADSDGLGDACDNCTLVANASQRDTNSDGFGNMCDPDFNGDRVVNFADLAYLKSKWLTADPDADLNGDNMVNFADLARLKSFWLRPPGPSGLVP
ncbi:MAG: S8 family serine peptidase [Thermodesulfobacteriota bacterium]